MVPEALFYPSDIGIRQAGLAESVGRCLQLFPPGIRTLLLNNIVLSGGNCCIPHFKKRLEYPLLVCSELNDTQDILPYVDEGEEIRMTLPDEFVSWSFVPISPICDTWRGGAVQARELDVHQYVTRELYEEQGALRLLYAFQMCYSVEQRHSNTSYYDLNFFKASVA